MIFCRNFPKKSPNQPLKIEIIVRYNKSYREFSSATVLFISK